jgi:excisionase family DNA binding protein
MNWITTQKAADELGVTIRTIERWRESGVLIPAQRTAGNHSRYTEQQICDLKNKRQLEQMML